MNFQCCSWTNKVVLYILYCTREHEGNMHSLNFSIPGLGWKIIQIINQRSAHGIFLFPWFCKESQEPSVSWMTKSTWLIWKRSWKDWKSMDYRQTYRSVSSSKTRLSSDMAVDRTLWKCVSWGKTAHHIWTGLDALRPWTASEVGLWCVPLWL